MSVTTENYLDPQDYTLTKNKTLNDTEKPRITPRYRNYTYIPKTIFNSFTYKQNNVDNQ